MSLRVKIIVHLVLIHVILAAAALVLLWERRIWLLAVEVLFAISIAVGVLFVRGLFVPLGLISTGTDLIAERDFSTHFREVGQPEMDRLIAVYNRMVDRLRAERVKLEEQQYLLDQIIEASPSGVLILDLDRRIERANRRARELLALPAGDGHALPRLDELEGPLGAAMATMEAGQTRVVLHQGSRRLRSTRAEFLDRGFERSFFLIDELTRELRASERAAYHKLIRTMSHELNNSVGAVSSLMDSCRTYAGQLRAEDRADFVEALDVSITRLAHLDEFMNAFADLVRLPPPERRPGAVRETVDRIVALLRADLETRRIACVWDVAEPMPPVDFDAAQLEQALVNVLKNAMEAIGEGGRIRLRLETRADGRHRLSITDDGAGLAAEARAALFTPFFSTKKNGRGLGLTVVGEILAQHRFDFGLEPASPRGTCFWVDFPGARAPS